MSRRPPRRRCPTSSTGCSPVAAALRPQRRTGGARDRGLAALGARRSPARPARRGSGRARQGHDPDAPPRLRAAGRQDLRRLGPGRLRGPRATQHALRTLEWLGRAENLCICGPSGTGKSHLVEALGHLAIDHGKTVAWHTLESLAALLRRHRADDTVAKAIGRLIRADLIVIDDVGMLPVAPAAAEALFRVVDAAYETRSLAITSNLHPSGFDELMPKTLAAATVDRLLHHAHVLVCEGGESYRLAQATRGQGVTPLT